MVAGVSSFGIGGTNAHIIIEEAPEVKIASRSVNVDGDVVLLSERSQTALEQLGKEIIGCMANESVEFESLVYTLKTGRSSFPVRRLLLGKGLDDIKAGLIKGSYRESSPVGKKSRVAFVFSGIEATDFLPGTELYSRSYHFKAYLDRCFDILNEKFGIALKK